MKDRIAIVKQHGEPLAALRKAMDYLGGMENYVKPGMKVLIKPNLCIDKDWTTGTTTNPAIVEAIVHLVREAGAREITIADGTTVGLSTEKVFEATGYHELAKRLGVRLVDLNSEDTVRIDIKDPISIKNIQVARSVLEADCLINVPVMKTHIHTGISVSLKNMKGVISPRTKRKSHLVGLEGTIADINRSVQSSLIIVDGTMGHEGLGPQSGTPVQMDLIIAGDKPLTVDTVTTRIMGFEPQDIKHLCYSRPYNLGTMDLEQIDIHGETIERVQMNFSSPLDAMKGGRYEDVNICSHDACSDCIGGLMVALRRIAEDGTMDLLRKYFGKINISLGKHRNIPSHDAKDGKWICIGKCQRGRTNGDVYIPGCPPPGFLIRDILRTLVGLEGLFEPDEFIEQEKHILEVEKQEKEFQELMKELQTDNV